MLKILNYKDDNFSEKLNEVLESRLTSRDDISDSVKNIISRVRKEGDTAVFELTKKFDNFDINESNIIVTKDELENAFASVDPELLEALETAFYRVRAYHQRQKPLEEKYTDDDGVILGWKYSPVESVGIYVPGGKAVYPSSVIMNAVPAIVAEVPRIVMAVPCPDGKVNPLVLAAARICGITEIYKIGGAQAIAALAYGTKYIRPTVKIVGPGNAYVAEAKRQVFGKVGIDMVAGPSEIAVCADKTADPKWIAVDMLSQAEHDEEAMSVLITDSTSVATKVCAEIEMMIERLDRRDIAVKSLRNFGLAIVVDNLETTGVKVINHIAPEHLEIITEQPEKISKLVDNAGAIFLGEYTPEAIGDYIAGPSHVLPTSGTAKFSSGLGVMDFLKRTSMIKCTQASFEKLADKVQLIAKHEKLDAHALSVKIRKIS